MSIRICSASVLLAPALLLTGLSAASASSSSVTVTTSGARSEVHTSSSGATATTSGAAATPGPAKAASEESVRRILREQGFTDIEDVKRQGTSYTARARKDGKEVDVEVSASSLGDDFPR